jgi:hypothetical protein
MIYIFGDSFSAWQNGWPATLHANTFSTRGSSEFRIWKNYLSNRHKISSIDTVLFCHTHWSRVYLRDDANGFSNRSLLSHPVCDLLLGDLAEKKDKKYQKLLEEVWDEEFLKYNYSKLIEDSKSVNNSLHITFFENVAKNYNINNFGDIWKEFPGNRTENHLTNAGNLEAARRLSILIKNI